MMYVVCLFVVIFAVKFLNNASAFLQCKFFYNIYKKFIIDDEWQKITSHQQKIISLFKNAGLEDILVPVVEPAGFGYIQTGNGSVFTNLTNKRKDIASHVIDLFYRAKGVYKDRMLEAFNPLFWIMFLVNLPENLFSYLGFSTENVFSRIIQLFYWGAATVTGLIVVTYETEISSTIRSWVDALLDFSPPI
jgi:hypothetical protein